MTARNTCSPITRPQSILGQRQWLMRGAGSEAGRGGERRRSTSCSALQSNEKLHTVEDAIGEDVQRLDNKIEKPEPNEENQHR